MAWTSSYRQTQEMEGFRCKRILYFPFVLLFRISGCIYFIITYHEWVYWKKNQQKWVWLNIYEFWYFGKTRSYKLETAETSGCSHWFVWKDRITSHYITSGLDYLKEFWYTDRTKHTFSESERIISIRQEEDIEIVSICVGICTSICERWVPHDMYNQSAYSNLVSISASSYILYILYWRSSHTYSTFPTDIHTLLTWECQRLPYIPWT